MVDAVVSYALGRLGDYLIQEAVVLRQVRNEVELLKNELEWMLCFVKDAEEKQANDALIHKWVSDIRDLAYDIEDVLDTHLLKVDDGMTRNSTVKVDNVGTSNRRSRFFASIKICSCISDTESGVYRKSKAAIDMYNIGKEIQTLRNRISDISNKRQLYGLQSIDRKSQEKNDSLGRLRQLRRASSFADEGNVVGFDDEAKKLLAKLLDDEPQRFVISIYGMGGLGKTTLAKQLYKHIDVKMKFDCCAWVSVSQDYKIRDLLVRIIKSFNIPTKLEDLENKQEEDLERYLHMSLLERSYVIVIDDVWEKEAWESLRRAFPNNRKGSRVIITTRSKEVAERSDERTHAHKLRCLRLDESWELFYDKAFRNLDADEGLEMLGREMVSKCAGLPLAIVVLAGLLSTKKPQEWHVVRHHMWRCLRNDSIHISYLFALSFNDLHYHSKLCFLYLSLFPEDFEINMEKLIRLLVAEDFISQDENQVTEEVVSDYMEELINKNLVQVEKRIWGRIATCRVHDLLRDLSIQKAKELNFLHIYDEIKQSNHDFSIISSCRREAIYLGSERNSLWLQYCNPRLRSLLFFNHYKGRRKIMLQLSHVCRRFMFLRVLNVDVGSTLVHAESLLEEIGKLIYLKYLGLENLYIHISSSSSILNLWRLQTLDLFCGSYRTRLPVEICKLQELRHLIGNFTEEDLLIDNLTKLQTLKYVQNRSWIKIQTAKLVNLRELWIHGKMPHEITKEFSFDSIAKLRSLRILSVSLGEYDSFASLQPLSRCQHLIDLRLCGKIEKLPEDIHTLLPNLECLLLKRSHLKDDPMPLLGKLRNLMILNLGFESYCGKQLLCKAHGFARLEIMELGLLQQLEEWQVQEGAMPKLRRLKTISKYSNFRMPEKFRCIPEPPTEWECDGSWSNYWPNAEEFRNIYKSDGNPYLSTPRYFIQKGDNSISV